MRFVVMKGYAGTGKSMLSRALSRELGCPLIDKDDIKDLLDSHSSVAGVLSYDIMFNIARRQLLQGLSVICDSPLTGIVAYEHAQAIAKETDASLGVIECQCSDTLLWEQRINNRKVLHLPAHHQTDWNKFQDFLRQPHIQANYSIVHPHIIVDTSQSLEECLKSVHVWLEHVK